MTYLYAVNINFTSLLTGEGGRNPPGLLRGDEKPQAWKIAYMRMNVKKFGFFQAAYRVPDEKTPSLAFDQSINGY